MIYPTRAGCALGLDCSAYQKHPDFARAKREAGVAFVFLKATEGATYTDPTFARNASAARAAGLLVGAYHFFRPEKQGAAQATHFAAVAGPVAELRPVIDMESWRGVEPVLVVRRALDFVDACEKAFAAPVVMYSYPAFLADLRNKAVTLFDELAGRCGGLWIAHYTKAAQPLVPKPWTSWQCWQFDGDKGLTLPDGTDCDFNWFAGDACALKATWGRTPAP